MSQRTVVNILFSKSANPTQTQLNESWLLLLLEADRDRDEPPTPEALADRVSWMTKQLPEVARLRATEPEASRKRVEAVREIAQEVIAIPTMPKNAVVTLRRMLANASY
jgi:hypothetical protein